MLDQYKPIRKLSSDEKRKFSEVYLCEDESGNQVTCKIIHKSRIEREAQLKRIHREGNFDPNIDGIPELIDFVETESEFVIVRKFIEGNTPDKICAKLWRKKRNAFVSDFYEKTSIILNELHSKGWMHLDLKPDNFIIDAEQNVHLIDFGLLQHKDEFIIDKTLFAMGFSPPEIILNHHEIVNYKSDYFSLGATVWNLLTGEIPLNHSHPAYMINLQITHPIPEHRRISKEWFETISKLCFKSQFPIPPNQMAREDVRKVLQKGIDGRPNQL